MSLYSSDSLSNANEGNIQTAPVNQIDTEKKLVPERTEEQPWFYLFVHHSKIDKVEKVLQREFRTFIHKTTTYTRQGKRIVKNERPSITGLLFVQGENGLKVQRYLDDNFPGIYLVKDYSVKQITTIPHRVMAPFMQLSQIGDNRVRFMPNCLDHYSKGNTLVTITSGILAGLEGYIVRIAREKRLVTTIGNMTVAISGINKESFENAEEYTRIRRQQQSEKTADNEITLTPVQAEIDQCFFDPQDRVDILAINKNLDKWTDHAMKLIAKGEYEEALDISIFILEEIGSRILRKYDRSKYNQIKDLVTDMWKNASRLMTAIEHAPAVSAELLERIDTEKQSLETHFPFMSETH